MIQKFKKVNDFLAAMDAGKLLGPAACYIEENGLSVSLGSSLKDESREVVDLNLPSGILWCKCDLGARHPDEIGDYYFPYSTKPIDLNVCNILNGSGIKNMYDIYDLNASLNIYLQDRLEFNNLAQKYTAIISNLTIRLEPPIYTPLILSNDQAHLILGEGFRLPFYEEIQELVTSTSTRRFIMNDNIISHITFYGTRETIEDHPDKWLPIVDSPFLAKSSLRDEYRKFLIKNLPNSGFRAFYNTNPNATDAIYTEPIAGIEAMESLYNNLYQFYYDIYAYNIRPVYDVTMLNNKIYFTSTSENCTKASFLESITANVPIDSIKLGVYRTDNSLGHGCNTAGVIYFKDTVTTLSLLSSRWAHTITLYLPETVVYVSRDSRELYPRIYTRAKTLFCDGGVPSTGAVYYNPSYYDAFCHPNMSYYYPFDDDYLYRTMLWEIENVTDRDDSEVLNS